MSATKTTTAERINPAVKFLLLKYRFMEIIGDTDKYG
jgi:hypothetical protein